MARDEHESDPTEDAGPLFEGGDWGEPPGRDADDPDADAPADGRGEPEATDTRTGMARRRAQAAHTGRKRSRRYRGIMSGQNGRDRRDRTAGERAADYDRVMAEVDPVNVAARAAAERFGETPAERAARLEATAQRIRENMAADREAREAREKAAAEAAAAREKQHEARLDAALAGDYEVELHAWLAANPERDADYYRSRVWPHRRAVLMAERARRDLDRLRASGKYQPY